MMAIRIGGIVLALVVTSLAPSRVEAWNRGRARVFATLPPDASGPEGLEVDADGNVYVATFGFTANDTASGEGKLFVFDRHGRLQREVSIVGSSPHLLGLRFNPSGVLLVVDFGNAQVLAVDDLRTGAAHPFMTLPTPLPHEGTAGLNDVTFDRAGNVYVSDSSQGVVWRTGPSGGVASTWADSELLRTTGVPPFGANGLRFNNDETAMFVANTGNDTLIRIPAEPAQSGPPDLVAGTPEVFTNSINGADGLLVDDHDNLWVVANQADEIVVVDPTGKVIAKLGDFDGLVGGSPRGLLFPASARFSGNDLLVTNLALNLRLFGLETVDSEWCAEVSRYNVAIIHNARGVLERAPAAKAR